MLKIVHHSNSLATWHGFSDITHIKVNNGRKLDHFEFDRRVYPSMKCKMG